MKRTPLNQRQKELLWAKQNGLCGVCRDPLEHGRFEDDHALALIDGGTNDLANPALGSPALPCREIGQGAQGQQQGQEVEIRTDENISPAAWIKSQWNTQENEWNR